MTATTQLVEQSITVTNPADGSPLTLDVTFEVTVQGCACEAPVASPGNPPGWRPKPRRRR